MLETLDMPAHPPIATTERRILRQSWWTLDASTPLVETTIGAVLSERARTHPTRLALVGNAHGSSDERRLTYAELHEEARRVAAGLLRVAGPGERVALWAPNVVEWPVILYGAALAGVVLVAVNPVFRAAELTYVLRDSRAVVLIHADRSRAYDMAAVVADVRPNCPDLREVISLSDTARWRAAPGERIDDRSFGPAASDPGAIAMLQYTSGTTGQPKGVLLRHRSLYNNAKLTMEAVEAPPGFVGVNPLPMFHTAACVIGTLGPLSLAGTALLVETFSGEAALDLMEREKANVLFMVPTVLGAILEAARLRPTVPRLEVLLGGAAMVPPTMMEAAERLFGAHTHILWGMTELSPVTTVTRRSDTRDEQLFSVGRPMHQVEVRVVDIADGRTVLPLGVEGELCARGYQQMVEYLGKPEATAAAVDADGWLHTGDLGTMDAHGVVKITGRLKELIIRGGENIAPAEIELHLVSDDRILQAAVVGLPDEKWGEVPAAVVVLRGGDIEGLRDELHARARQVLAPFKVPTQWFAATELPLTASGKVQKGVLRDQVIAGKLVPLR